MGAFKDWLRLQEIALGSDGMRDNAPTQTNKATQNVAQKWLASPKNADFTANMIDVGQQNPSTLSKQLIDAGSQAIKFSGQVGKGTTAPNVANFIQTQLKLPQVLPPPKPGKVSMMRKRMRKS